MILLESHDIAVFICSQNVIHTSEESYCANALQSSRKSKIRFEDWKRAETHHSSFSFHMSAISNFQNFRAAVPHILDDSIVTDWVSVFCLKQQPTYTNASLVFFFIHYTSCFYKLPEAPITVIAFQSFPSAV